MDLAAKITGIGSAFPEKVVTNEDIINKIAEYGLETSDEWIRDRTGVCERRHSDMSKDTDHNSSLGARAAEKAMEMAGATPEEIDLIIYATCTPDTPIVSSACWFQDKIGAKNACAMDMNTACSGFITGLAIAETFLQTRRSKKILVVGSEILSSIINWKDRNSCILFGDAAGAAVVEPVPADSESRILSSHMLSDGTQGALLYVPGGGSTMEMTHEFLDENRHKLIMKGREVFKVAVRTLADFSANELKHNNMTIDDIDWMIPHQANFRIIEAVANRLEFPMEKVILNVQRYGNTSSATIPSAMDEAVRDGRIKKGDTLLLCAFGAGFNYGSLVMRW